MSHYLNCLFKYTQIADFHLYLLIKHEVAPPLLLLQAELSGGDREHLMTVESSFPKGAILIMRDASYSKLLSC